MSTEREKLLAEIESFLERSGLEHTTFGTLAMNDTAFVTQMRRGRNVRIDTAERARDFMAAWKPPKPRPKRAAAQAAA